MRLLALRTIDQQRFRRVTLLMLGLAVLAAGAGFRLHQLRNDRAVAFLESHPGAEWIRAEMPFELKTYTDLDTWELFATSFDAPASIPEARFEVLAFRRFEVELDGKTIHTSPSDGDASKQIQVVQIPGPLEAGPHFLRVTVFNREAHACLWLRSDELGLHTGTDWLTTADGQRFSKAVSVDRPTQPDLALEYPRVRTSFVALAPWIGGVFVVSLLWWGYVCQPSAGEMRVARWHFGASVVRWILLAMWIALSINNIWQLDPRIGYDVSEHFKYVRFIAREGLLPLATDGWQMFQSPLFYLLAAPFDVVMSSYLSDDSIIKALRFLPLLCGLAQIELVYRAARAVFPLRDDQQTIAVLVGGLMPMQVYISQVIGNEPLAGVLTSLLVLVCLLLLIEPERRQSRRYFALIGLVWGLALLSKVTPILLAPWVIGVAAVACFNSGATLRAGSVRVGVLLGSCLATCGWYYLRNWYWLGTPFVGGWDSSTGQSWWQEPSYRTSQQLISFGTALDRPIFSGVWSLWDSLYSSMWLDGFTSGVIVSPQDLPWDVDWMTIGSWLAIVPVTLLLSGFVVGWWQPSPAARRALYFCMIGVLIYLGAVADLFIRLPIYSTAKATYMLGMLPCYALLAAAGAAPWLRFRALRVLTLAAVTCWGAAAYLAYWVR